MTCFFSIAAMLAAVALDGITAASADLRATVSFDANNVHVGDPMALYIDFFGSADFSSIHAPKLSRAVDRKTWRIDDASAKTETYRNARRLKYRVRPMCEGLIEFPPLEFEYVFGKEGEKAMVKTCAVPVHAKPGSQIALAGVDGEGAHMPMPDGIICDIESHGRVLGEDEMFAWRKACAAPEAKAFAQFDFPEARLNEAACETIAGNWARALNIYSFLEWRTGQTQAIERGIVAALARKTGDPAAELPMWRKVLRPVLRLAWPGRLAALAALAAAVALASALLRRLVRAFAIIVVAVAMSGNALAQSVNFEEADRLLQEMQRRMQQQMQEVEAISQSFGFGGGNGMGSMTISINGEQQKPVEIVAKVFPDKKSIVVGDTFNFIIELEMPRNCTVSGVQFAPSQTTGLVSAGAASALEDAQCGNTNRVVRRMAAPVRYDAPFKGIVGFEVHGMHTVNMRSSNRGSMFSQTYSSSFTATAPAIEMEVKPLSSDDQPKNFSGAVGTSFRLKQHADRYKVETNDVVKTEWTLQYKGYLPPGALPGMIEAGNGQAAGLGYFIADGRTKTDDISLVYYDTAERKYKTITSRGMPLHYIAAAEIGNEEETVVVNAAKNESGPARAIRLLFHPSDDATEVAVVPVEGAMPPTVETYGEWSKVDDGSHAGWIRTEDLQP